MRAAARRARRGRRGRDRRRPTSRRSIAFVVDDPRYPGSIVHSLEAAWENARGAREAISSEMWESINTTHATLAAAARWLARSRGTACSAGCATAPRSWPASPTRRMSHDDALAVHRARPHARTGRHDRAPALDPARRRVGDRRLGRDAALLRGLRGVPAHLPARVSSGPGRLEFLLLDRLFPRSVFHALSAAESVLFDLDPRPGPAGERRAKPRRVVGRACAELEFVRADELEASLPAHLARLEQRRHDAHDAIAERFFHARPRSGGAPDDAGGSRSSTSPSTVRRRRARVVQRGPHHARARRASSCSTIASTVTPARPDACGTSTTGERGVRVRRAPSRHRRLVVTGRSLVETPSAADLPDDAMLVGRSARRLGVATSSTSILAPVRRSSRATTSEFVTAAVELTAGRTGAMSSTPSCRWTREQPGVRDRAPPTCRPPRATRSLSGAVSARTSCTSRSRCSARAASRRATRPATCIRTRTPRSATAVTGQSHAWLEAWIGVVVSGRPDERRRRRRAPRARRPRPRLRRRRAAEGRVPRPPRPERRRAVAIERVACKRRSEARTV